MQVLLIKYPRCFDCRQIVSIGEQLPMLVFRPSEQGKWVLQPSGILCCVTRCLLPKILRLCGDLIFKGWMSSEEIKFVGHLTLEDETTVWSWNVGQQTPNGRVQYCRIMKFSIAHLCFGGTCHIQLQGCPRRPSISKVVKKKKSTLGLRWSWRQHAPPNWTDVYRCTWCHVRRPLPLRSVSALSVNPVSYYQNRLQTFIVNLSIPKSHSEVWKL